MPSPGRPKKEPANPDASKDPRTSPQKESGLSKDDPEAAETVERARKENEDEDARQRGEIPELSDLPEPAIEPPDEDSVEVATAPQPDDTPKMYTYNDAPTGFGPNSRLTPPGERR